MSGAPKPKASIAIPPSLTDFVAIELLRFTRDEDEAECANKIIREVLRQCCESTKPE